MRKDEQDQVTDRVGEVGGHHGRVALGQADEGRGEQRGPHAAASAAMAPSIQLASVNLPTRRRTISPTPTNRHGSASR